MKNIIAAIDFSDVTDAVIDQAADLAKLHSANLWIIHVEMSDYGDCSYTFNEWYENLYSSNDWESKKDREEYKHVMERAKELEKEGLVVIILFPEGEVVKTLLEEEQDLHADLVVTGSHTHNYIYQRFVGSVADSLLRKSECPLMIVPSKKEAKVLMSA